MNIGPKMISAFLIVTMFTGIIGVYGIYELSNMSNSMEQIRDESWVLANAAMEMRLFNSVQDDIVHSHLAGDFEPKDEFTQLTTEFMERFNDVELILGTDHILLTTISSDYLNFRELIEGTTSSDGLFVLNENKFQIQNNLHQVDYKLFNDIQSTIEGYLVTIEENAKEDTGYNNFEVADRAMELKYRIMGSWTICR